MRIIVCFICLSCVPRGKAGWWGGCGLVILSICKTLLQHDGKPCLPGWFGAWEIWGIIQEQDTVSVSRHHQHGDKRREGKRECIWIQESIMSQKWMLNYSTSFIDPLISICRSWFILGWHFLCLRHWEEKWGEEGFLRFKKKENSLPKRNLATDIRNLKMSVLYDTMVLLLEINPKNTIQNF